MPKITRYHPVNHDFNRDPEIVQARKNFGDWIGYAWLECLSIGDRNKGIVPGTIDQIADRLAPNSLQKYHKRAADCAKNFLRYAEELGWIRVKTDYILILKYGNYHRTRGTKQGLSETSETSDQPKQPKKHKNASLPTPPAEAIECAQLLSDKIFTNFPSRTAPTESQLLTWAHDAEKLHRIDLHAWAEILDLIEWCQSDQFWRANILSMSKLREKWTQLIAKKGGANGQNQSSTINEPKGFASLREWRRIHGLDPR